MGEARQPELARKELDNATCSYRELVEALPLVTYIDEVGDRATNVYTSPQVADLLGRTPEEWLDDPDFFGRIIHPDDRDRVLAELAHSNATREPFRELLDAPGALTA